MSDESDKLPLAVSFRDLVGYLAPGGVFFGAIWIYEALGTKWTIQAHLPGARAVAPIDATSRMPSSLHDVADSIGMMPNDPNWLVGSIAGLSLVLSLYIAGHVIASLSSTFIERFLVFKGYGYPYETQLDLKEDSRPEATRWSNTSRPFYRAIFFFINAYGLFRYFWWVTPADLTIFRRVGNVQGLLRFLWLATMVTLGALVVFMIFLSVAHIRAVRREEELERASRRAASVTSVDERSRIVEEIDKLRNADDARDVGPLKTLESLVKWLAKPYDWVGELVARYMGTRRVFGKEFRERYTHNFRREFRQDAERASTNNFWLSYAHVMVKSPALARKLQNWQTQYSFSRNLATAFYLAFVYCWFWTSRHAESIRSSASEGFPLLAVLPFLYYFLGSAMLLRYYYLYRGYFTKFVFRAFVYLCEQESRRRLTRKRRLGLPGAQRSSPS